MSAAAELVEEAPGPTVDVMRRDLASWFEVNYGFTPLWLEWLISGEIDGLEEVIDFNGHREDPHEEP